ncbi:hypothetical protein U2J09_22685 [Serratia liquefaciens]
MWAGPACALCGAGIAGKGRVAVQRVGGVRRAAATGGKQLATGVDFPT